MNLITTYLNYMNRFSDIIKEVISPDSVDVSSIKMNETLSPIVWDTDDKTMKPEIRKALLKNADAFIKFSNLEEFNFVDIILTGSMANYNYNEYSDLDIHILMDFFTNC